MALYEISEHDAEFIQLMLDQTLIRQMKESETVTEFAKKAHAEYNLGEDMRAVDKRALDSHRDILLSLKGVVDRFAAAKVDELDTTLAVE